MKKQRFQWMIAAILTVSGTAMLTSCIDKDDNPTPTPTNVEQPENPTEDAVSVTTDKTYVMYGDFDEEFGNALGRRLNSVLTSPSHADIFFVDPLAVNQLGVMSIDDLKTMIRRTESGEASLVLTKSTFREFYDWAQTYVMGYLLMELENFNGDYDSPEAAPARRKVANIVRNAYVAGQHQTATTRGTTVNGMELDWEHVNTWPEEQQNAVMFDGFAQSGDNELFIMNAAATLNADTDIEQPQNDYEWGHKADAMVDWLNRQGKENAQTRAGLKDFAHAVTLRAEGSTDISELMGAQTKEFVFDYKYPCLTQPGELTAYSAIKVQYRVYSAYDFGGNVEYYQVRQNIIVMNDKIFADSGENGWPRESDGAFATNWFARGAWMKSIDTKMWLEGSGTKSIISAAPLNENGTSSGSSSTGGSTTTTTGYTNGYSLGGSISGSYSGGSGLGGALGFNGGYNHTSTYSTATGITWSTTTSWNKKDVTTTYTEDNDDNKTVSWEHKGNVPTTDEEAATVKDKDLLTGTCNTDEQVLWKVQNPSGNYILKANFNVESEIMKIGVVLLVDAYLLEESVSNEHHISFELNAPDRYKAEWNNYVIDYGSVQGDIVLTGKLDEYLEKTYGVSTGNKCWAGLFISTETTADGSDNARAIFQTFKNSIRGMKQEMRIKGFGGRVAFGLKRNGVDADGVPYDPVDQIALVLDGTGYNEGETFTEKLNGYKLTYKVTKKGKEVELIDVPKDFSGELVIPERVGEGNYLAVTSWGVNCTVDCSDITAVTIPSTVKTIQTGALSGLNITEVNIPEGVQTIGSWSFKGDKQVTNVYLPSTLKEIQNCAFYYMDELAEVHIKATTPPTLGSYIFYPRYKDAVLYVPKGYKQDYANAKEWKYFTNIIEE